MDLERGREGIRRNLAIGLYLLTTAVVALTAVTMLRLPPEQAAEVLSNLADVVLPLFGAAVGFYYGRAS